jgi:hypothetical protein
MEHIHWRLAALIVALIVAGCLTGGGIYEQSVLDTAWPRKPSIVRPVEGGANHKLFWVPANIVAVVTLPFALVAAWPIASARYATLVAVALFAVINLVTVAYFGPEVLRAEKSSPPPDHPSSLAWVRRSRWRTPLSLGVNAALGMAIVMGATIPMSRTLPCGGLNRDLRSYPTFERGTSSQTKNISSAAQRF